MTGLVKAAHRLSDCDASAHLHAPTPLLAERGLDVSYETIRRWVIKFGPAYARNLRRQRLRPSDQWHLDEMVVSIQGRCMDRWRAVDSQGEILDIPVQANSHGRSTAL